MTVRLYGEPDGHVMASINAHSVCYEPVLKAPAACEGSSRVSVSSGGVIDRAVLLVRQRQETKSSRRRHLRYG